MQRSSFIPNRTWLNNRSRAPGCPNHLVTAPAGDNFHTKVQLEFNSSDRTAPKKGQTGSPKSPCSPDVIPGTPMQDMGRAAGRKAKAASPTESLLMEDQLSSYTVTVRPIAVTKTARLPDKSAIPTPSAGTVPLDKVMHFLTTFAKEFREDMATTTKQLLTAFDKRLSSVEDRLANAERELKELRTSNKKLASEVSRCVSGTSLERLRTTKIR